MVTQGGTQDLPPPGGFPETVRYKRYLPKRGPPGWAILSIVVGCMAYGASQQRTLDQDRRELKREKIWNRLFLVPLLQAEADRDLVRRYESLKQKEAEIMKNVLGWVPMDLHAPVPGLGKFGVLDPLANEPVYHNKQFKVEPNVILDLKDNSIIPAQSWRGQKVIFKNPPFHERADKI